MEKNVGSSSLIRTINTEKTRFPENVQYIVNLWEIVGTILELIDLFAQSGLRRTVAAGGGGHGAAAARR